MHAMIVLKAYLTIDPDSRDAFLHHMQVFIQASLAEEGCLSFGCYEDMAAPNSFLVLEEWSSRDALERHEQSEHLRTFRAAAGKMIVSRRETQVYTVSEVGGLHAS